MSDKITELAANMILGIQTRNAGIAGNLKSRFERSSAKLQSDLKSPPSQKATTPNKPGIWFLARKPWAWKYRDQGES